MKVETHVNGSLQLIVIPENDLERAILSEFINRSSLGKKMTVSGFQSSQSVEPGCLKVSLEA